MRTLHTSARPVSRQGTIVFDPRVPATPRVPLRCVRYYDAKIRFRSTKTLHRAGSGVAHSGGYVLLVLCASDLSTSLKLNNYKARLGKNVLARCFPADLISHLTDSRLPSRAHEKSIDPSTRQTCKKAPLPAQYTVFWGAVLSCKFAEWTIRWTSPVL